MAASTDGASTSSPLSSVSDRLALDSDSDTSSSFVVSLLDRLKLPTAADIAQKRQTKIIDSPPRQTTVSRDRHFGSQEY